MADTGRTPEQELREALETLGPHTQSRLYEDALAALGRLVAERDEARSDVVLRNAELKQAEARVEALQEALEHAARRRPRWSGS